MRALRSLRGQLAAGAAVLVLLIVALSGLVIVLGLDARDRDVLDAQLQNRLERVGDDVGKLLDGREEGPPKADDDVSDSLGGLLVGSESLVRLLASGRVLAQRGEVPDQPLAVPDGVGYSTVTIDGVAWRSLVGEEAGGVRVQVLKSLDSIQERFAGNAWLVSVVTLVATVIAGFGGWLLARLVLAPLDRLAVGARAIRVDRDVDFRLPEVRAPREIAELSGTLNGMLERLKTGMLATRRFTADAGHELRTPLASLGAQLEILARNPDLDADERTALLDAAAAEHRRMAALLDGLQTLARGDAEALPALEPIDVVDLVAEATSRARRRNPGIDFRFEDAVPAEAGVVDGWVEGLRLAVENLLGNAAKHGRPDGRVDVRVDLVGERIRVAVDDDGPGIPEDRRLAMTQRFARGPSARGEGSGLGLALVEQQARLHGGRLVLADSPLGGLSAVFELPAGPLGAAAEAGAAGSHPRA